MSFAPDGDRLALTLYHGLTVQQDIFLFDLVRGDYDPLTTDPHNDFHPHFSPDGQQIAFTSRRGGGADLYVVPSDKSRPAELLYANEYAKWTDSWLPDGTLLAFHQEHPETGWDVWTYAIGESEARPLLTERFNEGESAFSPDGLWIAYQSDEGGQNEVYVASFPGLGRRCKVSVDGGEKPQWASDGTELFFSKPLYGTQVAAMVVDVSNRDFCDSDPQPLFDGMDHYQWNVSPTGDFFVTVAPRDPPRLNLVLNWFEELTRLVPTGR